jgi:S-formylglutathione hydrolase
MDSINPPDGVNRVEHHASFGGWQDVWQHRSTLLGCDMRFGLYLPPQIASGACPIVYWLSGLTCSEQNFITKAGAQRAAAELGVVVVVPDTSPRGEAVADDENYDLGQGAGFYVNATESPWAAHYRMYDYVVAELPALVEKAIPFSGRRSVMGHSMGGHGALVVALRNAERYACVSVFAPIVAPTEVPWGRKALTAYLGSNEAHWAAYDACKLVAARARDGKPPLPEILIDQGEADDFLGVSLTPERFEAECAAARQPLRVRRQPGYDHSYYFIASFLPEHLARHAKRLRQP